jgi:hypothetical protein
MASISLLPRTRDVGIVTGVTRFGENCASARRADAGGGGLILASRFRRARPAPPGAESAGRFSSTENRIADISVAAPVAGATCGKANSAQLICSILFA